MEGFGHSFPHFSQLFTDSAQHTDKQVVNKVMSHKISPPVTFRRHVSSHKCLGFSFCGLFLYALFNKTNKCSLWTCIQPSDFDVVSL